MKIKLLRVTELLLLNTTELTSWHSWFQCFCNLSLSRRRVCAAFSSSYTRFAIRAEDSITWSFRVSTESRWVPGNRSLSQRINFWNSPTQWLLSLWIQIG